MTTTIEPTMETSDGRIVKTASVWSKLYRGATAFDFVGRKKIWFSASLILIIVGLFSLGFRGLNLSIDFKGGTGWELTSHNLTTDQVKSIMAANGVKNASVEVLGGKTISVSALLKGSSDAQTTQRDSVTNALAKADHISPNSVSVSFVGPTWGSDISSKAIRALILFFVAIAIYLSIRFEWKMAVAALVALVHDLLITVGVYSISGFQVTPDTVIAVLTILGYSLYDTVVVFDRVEESVGKFSSIGKLTYSDTVNLSMNQVLMRSINTSLVAIMPILSVLVIGAFVLGATTLQYFGLALLIGLLSGAYSSIFIASPLLAILKEREPRYVGIRQKLAARGEEFSLLTPAAAALQGATPPGRLGKAGRAGAPRPGKAGGVLKPSAQGAGSAQGRAGAATASGSDEGIEVEEGAGSAPASGGSATGAKAAGARQPSKGGGVARPAGAPRPRKKKRR